MNILIHESCFGLSNIHIVDSGMRKGATVVYCWLILADFLTYLFIIVIYLSYCDHILQSTTRCSIHQNSPFALYQVQKGRSFVSYWFDSLLSDFFFFIGYFSLILN